MSLENQREEYSVPEESYVGLLNKIRENPRLSAPKLQGIVENTQGKLCVTKQFAVCCISMTFMVKK